MGLSVVTVTRDLNEPTLETCRLSVSKALFAGAKHEIVHCPNESSFNEVRYKAMLMDEFTVVVDDDDFISEDGLKLCFAAMQHYDADIVFTDETQRNITTGQTFDSRRGRREYSEVQVSPQAIHHLVLIRSSKIDPHALELAQRFGVGIDWLIHASVALTGKAIHIAKPCYTWNRHRNQHSAAIASTFNEHFPEMRKAIKERWNTNVGRIPQANIQELEAFIKEKNW